MTEEKNQEKDSFPEEWKIYLEVTKYSSCPFQVQDREAPSQYNCRIHGNLCSKANCTRKVGRFQGGLIPYFMCLECKRIYRADELSALPSDWDSILHLFKCKECETINLIKICPFESRCIIPLIMKPQTVTYGKHLNTWFCVFHGKLKECPVYAIFSGEQVR